MSEPQSQWTPPDWMKDDVDLLLRMAMADRLHTSFSTNLASAWVWFRDQSDQARPATDEQGEAAWILEERGYVTPTARRVLKDESGEPFNAECMEITQAGRELFDRMDRKG